MSYWPTKPEKYIANRIKGMNMQDAANTAGYPPSTSRKAGERLESKHMALLKEQLPIIGAHSRHLAEVLAAGLGAKRVFQDKLGLHEADIPDHKERRETVKLIAQITGELDTTSKVAVQIVLPAVATDKSVWGEE